MLRLNVSWEKTKIYIIRFSNFIKLGDYNAEYLLLNCEELYMKTLILRAQWRAYIHAHLKLILQSNYSIHMVCIQEIRCHYDYYDVFNHNLIILIVND